MFISRTSYKIYENTIKSPKCMQGQFWPKGLMFHTPGLNLDLYLDSMPHTYQKFHESCLIDSILLIPKIHAGTVSIILYWLY